MDSKINIENEVIACPECGHIYFAFASHKCSRCGDCLPFCFCSDEEQLS